jgi:hypothetical protein
VRLLITLAAAGAAVTVVWRPPAPPLPAAPASASAPETRRASPPILETWPARLPLAEPRGELFGRPAPSHAPAGATAPAAAAAQPPPLPYRVAGKVVRGGVTTVLLAREEAVLPVEAGDTLEGGYRVESIDAVEITLRYLPLGSRQRLELSAPPDRSSH